MAHACNPRTLGGQGRQITRSGAQNHFGQYGETSSLLKIQKFSWAWWCMPIISDTQGLRQENCLNPGGGVCGEPRLHHCTPSSLGSKSKTPSQKYIYILLFSWNGLFKVPVYASNIYISSPGLQKWVIVHTDLSHAGAMAEWLIPLRISHKHS